jgi:hypothetical protein
MPLDYLDDEQILAMSADEQADYIKRALSDQWWRLNNLYWITDKNGQRVKFRLNAAQRLLFENMWFFNIILKARQLGFSTVVQIFILDSALFNENLNCGIVAQDLPKAREIFRTKIMYPYDNLPNWVIEAVPTVMKNTTEILFCNGSKITVSTGFRSGTVNILHVSEFAKICATRKDKAQEVIDGTLNAVHPGNIAFIESTAEGAAGHYYDMCLEAQELQSAGLPLTEIDFKFFFFPWWDEPSYVMAVPEGGLKLNPTQDKYFKSLEIYLGKAIPEERKAWYVAKERQQKGQMKQEFPSTPEEAFLTSGRKVFDNDDLNAAKGKVIAPILIYDINTKTGIRKVANRSVDTSLLQRTYTEKTSKAVMNYLLVWEMPEPDLEYVIGGDVSEGLEKGDRSSLDILEKHTGRQVAHWYGKVSPSEFGELIAYLGRWYNMAFVGVERNNHGHATLAKLREIYPLGLIYREEYMDREIADDETQRIGWHTSAVSKEILISDMDDSFKANKSGIRWTGTLNEFYTFVRDERGRPNAMNGAFDDQVMSYMIAQVMRAKAPAKQKPVKIENNSTKHWMAT